MKLQTVGYGIAAMVASSVWAFARPSTLWLSLLIVAGAVGWPLIRQWRLAPPRRRRRPGFDQLLPLMEPLVVGMSLAVIRAHSARFSIQVLLAVALGIWALWVLRGSWPRSSRLLHGAAFVLGLEAVFLAGALTPLPTLLVLMLVWLLSGSLALAALTAVRDKAAPLIAAVWALLSVEITWVLLHWNVVYSLPGGYLVVPQGVLVLGGLAYSLGGVYFAQQARQLSRERLIEYLSVAGAVMLLVVLGTPWRV